ncbi:dynein light chain 2, cytoplasmic-like [Bactrocera neohumeralis]|uniref:dynein light chain 2, cytoplasmic-like n=1 Tax=Bactrocera neohumeralis TaxID=98809 RepID=UPI002165AFD3|nr:dynein light chain 2, cytoplasmic-like [Bactrocera neohumeralis]
MAGTEVVIKESAMAWDQQQDCVDCAAHALNVLKLDDQSAIAQFIKTELDAKYGHRWHCVVGHDFGSLVGHEGKDFLYMCLNSTLFIMVWRVEKQYEEKAVSVNTLLATQQVKRDAAPAY